MELRAVVVEHVEPASKAEQAGVKCGDRLTSYAGQPLTSPAMLRAIEENTFGPESVALCGEQGGQAKEWILPPGESGMEARPELAAAVLAEYQRGRSAFQVKNYAEAVRVWSDVAPQISETTALAWLYQKVGEAAGAAFDHQCGMDALTAACGLLDGGADTAARAIVRLALGRCSKKLNAPDSARRWFDLARQADAEADRPLWVARDLNALGTLAWEHGDLSAARDHLTHALSIGGPIAPDSLEVAESLNGLGIVATHRNDLALARDFLTRALEAHQRRASGPLAVAHCLNNLGFVAWSGGDLREAQDHFARTLELLESAAPDTTSVAKCFNNLGAVALKRGDLATAQDYYRRGLGITERLAPGSLEVAWCLLGLGTVALERDDLEAAEDWLARALEIQKRLAPDALETAATLNNLGDVAAKSGDLPAAQDYLTQALKIWERIAAGSLEAASTLSNLGDVALKGGEFSAAQGYFTRALGIWERRAPGWPDHATTLEGLGRVALSRCRPAEARECYRQAVEIIETQRTQIPTSEARALLLSLHIPKYRGLMQAYLELGDIGNAFHTLERARARSFLELLTDRTLDMADVPPELLRHQQDLDGQRGAAYDQLGQLTGADPDTENVEALHRTLRSLERRQQELTAQIRATSPRYASLQYPQPLTLTKAQVTLEPGSLLLSYLVDDDQTFLFAVTRTHAEAHILPVGREALQERVRSFRQALDRNRLTHDSAQEAALGRALYAQLVAPQVQGLVRRAERLLLCPDGPLHTLPFAALVMSRQGRPGYLGAVKPLSHILSMTTHAQTLASHSRTTSPRLLAFGDPRHTEVAREANPMPAGAVRAGASSDELSLLQTRGLALTPLPHSRAEVEALARLFGDDATVRLGSEATKGAVLREAGGADLLHLACHAWFDPQMPLSSGLVLSRPEAAGEAAGEAAEDNGLLQAWEIFQKLRLSADLVVLSACQSGLGQEVRGEGMVGLTRAFQYAGARSLAVSLWDVNDESTSLFMQAFYTQIKAGASKDDALRQGMLALRSDPRWDAPCYWGAFVLIGDRN